MTRSVLFDLETTGLSPEAGDRVIEIAALELVNDVPTGKNFHVLIDPERDIPNESTRVHGFTYEHLHGKPKFVEIVDSFLAFIEDSPLIAHNAGFDFSFLNMELQRAGYTKLDIGRMIDTLEIARKKYSGMTNSLDALCRRFNIDLSERTTHNALLDCKLLAQVYVELIGGRQRGLELVVKEEAVTIKGICYNAPENREIVRVVPSSEELIRHDLFVKEKLKNSLWDIF